MRALMDAIVNNDFLVSSQVGTVAGSQFRGRYILTISIEIPLRQRRL